MDDEVYLNILFYCNIYLVLKSVYTHIYYTNIMIACIGTENVALVAGLGEASRLALAESGSMLLHLLSLKHRLVSALLQGFAAEVW